MEIGLRLTELMLTGLIIIGWGKFFSLVLETIFEAVKDKFRK